VIAALLAVGAVLFLRKRRKHGTCAICASASQFGYSAKAESKAEDIVSLCLTCLGKKLAGDYQAYGGKALVIAPAANLPCYVFQPKSKWAESALMKEASEMFSKMEETCKKCRAKARCLWMTSNGLPPSNFEEVLSKGASRTLLQWGNPRAISVCGKCCVKLIGEAMQDQALEFLEVCAPRSEDGFVMPMAY